MSSETSSPYLTSGEGQLRGHQCRDVVEDGSRGAMVLNKDDTKKVRRDDIPTTRPGRRSETYPRTNNAFRDADS